MPQMPPGQPPVEETPPEAAAPQDPEAILASAGESIMQLVELVGPEAGAELMAAFKKIVQGGPNPGPEMVPADAGMGGVPMSPQGRQ